MFTIEVSDDMALENFKALCEFECGIPAREISLVLNGIPLQDDKKKLEDYGVKDGEVLLLQRIRGSQSQTAAPQQSKYWCTSISKAHRQLWSFVD